MWGRCCLEGLIAVDLKHNAEGGEGHHHPLNDEGDVAVFIDDIRNGGEARKGPQEEHDGAQAERAMLPVILNQLRTKDEAPTNDGSVAEHRHGNSLQF